MKPGTGRRSRACSGGSVTNIDGGSIGFEHVGVGLGQDPLAETKRRSIPRFEGPEPAVAEHLAQICESAVTQPRLSRSETFARGADLLDERIDIVDGIAVDGH